MDRIRDEADVRPVLTTAPVGIEAVRRSGTDADYLFQPVHGSVTVPAGGVAVVRETR